MKKIFVLYGLFVAGLILAIHGDSFAGSNKGMGPAAEQRCWRTTDEGTETWGISGRKERPVPGRGGNPKAQKIMNPLIPMGAITGRPGKAVLRKYLDNFREAGISQFLIYPRSGLEFEYMGDEWMDACGHILEYAREYGMKVWLYDEYNWPSGSCQGQVLRMDENFSSKKISVWKDTIRLGKNNYYWGVTSVPLYADLLNPGAVESFITLTHEKYYQRFRDYFGTVIKGIFSDEPSPMYGGKQTGCLLELTYWTGMEEEYNKFTGRDFRRDVESHLNGNTPPDLWKDYYYLLGKRFREVYLDRILAWCDSHQILFTGHLMSETPPRSALLASGDPMGAIHSFSLPGLDEISTKTQTGEAEWVTMKMVENAASAKGGGALAELFALGPPDMTLGKRRQMIWMSALHGVDHYLLAIAPVDSRANIEKPAYYNPHTVTQPWFHALRELGEDAEMAARYAGKKAIRKIAVRYPQSLTASTLLMPGEKQPVFNLQQFFSHLINRQWNPELIPENDSLTSGYKALFSLTPNAIREEISGHEFRSWEELASWMERHLKRDVLVKDQKGELLPHLLVKSYEDGSVCVVSLLDEDRGEVTMELPGQRPVVFGLPECGVFTWQPGMTDAPGKPVNSLLIDGDEQLPFSLGSDNIQRMEFDPQGMFVFSLDEPHDGLRIAVRKYGNPVSLELDGRKLNTGQECQVLTEGLRELYTESIPFSLGAGRHILKLASESPDYPYLPSAFIAGKFASGNSNLLKKMPETLSIEKFRGEGFKDYTGMIAFRKKVKTGKHDHLSVNTKGLVSEVFMNGQSLGKKAWAPFLWEIPKKFRGKTADVEIVIWTSVGPLFGDYPRKTGTEGSWLKNFAPQ